MAKWLIILLIISGASFSAYLTPAPLNRKSVLHFIQFFLLITLAVVGLFMMIPFAFNWQLPLQQGLGSNSELLVKGLLLSVACLFCIIVTNVQSEGSLSWIKAILLLLVGIPEFSRVLDFLNRAMYLTKVRTT